MPSPLIFPSTLIPTKIEQIKPSTQDFCNSRSELSNAEVVLNKSDTNKITLQISFKNRKEDEVQELVQFYAQCRGSYRAFYLPDDFWKHGSEIREAIHEMTNTTLWRFNDSQPNVENQWVGVYNFSLNLDSVKAPKTDDIPSNYFPIPLATPSPTPTPLTTPIPT